MKDEENKDLRDEDEVKITDLESAGQSSNIFISQAVARFVQRAHSSAFLPALPLRT